MATPTAPPEDERQGVRPVLVVLGTVLAVVVLTLLISSVGNHEGQDFLGGGGSNLGGGGGAGGGVCGQATVADSSYHVDVAFNPDPPRPEGTTLLMTVTHDGKPIAGAKVCLTADMPEMQHPAINATARESDGRYEAKLQFGMGGTWKTWVTVAEPDKPVVSVPLSVEVAQLSPN